jgi:hypothetical protein
MKLYLQYSRTMEAKGFSTHFSSAIAITAASLILGCAINADSKATLEIHSPPLFLSLLYGL